MGKLRNYTVSRHAASTSESRYGTTTARRSPKRLLGLALVAAVGIAAGSGLGAVLYAFDNDSSMDTVSEESSVSLAFAAAAEAVFDTSPVSKKTAPEDEAAVNTPDKTVTAALPSDSGDAEEIEAERGLTWTPGENEKAKLPNVVVVSSVTRDDVTSDGVARPQPTRVASMLPENATARQITGDPQTLEPAGVERFGTTAPRLAFAKDPLSARALKERFEAGQQRSAASASSDANGDAAEAEAEVTAKEYELASLGSRHFIALPDPVATVAEAVALQNGWKTTASKNVNLRESPDDDSEIITTVPAQAELLIESDCGRWCLVIYKGKKGYVHNSYVSQPIRPEVKVEVAETEAEVIALETRMAELGSDEFVAPAKSEAAYAAKSAADKGYTKSTAAKHVNMRAAPDKNAEVLTIVPVNAEFMADLNCRHWCSVVYKGRKGYIYRTYIE